MSDLNAHKTPTQKKVADMFGVTGDMPCAGIAFGRHQDGSPPNFSFHDELSRREYGITGMCQDCQDLLFNQEEDNDPDDYCNTCHEMIHFVSQTFFDGIFVTEYDCGHSQWLWKPDRIEMEREEALTDGFIL